MYILALMAVSGPSLRLARRSAERTFPTLTFSHVADAAYVCSCGGTFLAAQRISPNQPFRASKLDNSKLHFCCVRAQQSGRGLSRYLSYLAQRSTDSQTGGACGILATKYACKPANIIWADPIVILLKPDLHSAYLDP